MEADKALTDVTGGFPLKIRNFIVPAVLMMALVGCASEAETSDATSSAGADDSSPSATPTPDATVAPVTLPGDCESLVPLAVVHAEFSADFNPVAYTAHPEDLVGQSFADRNGLNCIWAIPRSEGFVSVRAAERETVSDDAQITAWSGAGFTECTSSLDGCFSSEEETMVSIVHTVYALAGGFELRATTSAGSANQLLVVVTEAATNMGYR